MHFKTLRLQGLFPLRMEFFLGLNKRVLTLSFSYRLLCVNYTMDAVVRRSDGTKCISFLNDYASESIC